MGTRGVPDTPNFQGVRPCLVSAGSPQSNERNAGSGGPLSLARTATRHWQALLPFRSQVGHQSGLGVGNTVSDNSRLSSTPCSRESFSRTDSCSVMSCADMLWLRERERERERKRENEREREGTSEEERKRESDRVPWRRRRGRGRRRAWSPGEQIL